MNRLIALVGGLLVAASLPPWGWWPLAVVGIAVFETSVIRLDRSGVMTRRSFFVAGWLFGVGWLAPGLAWMWFLTAPGYVIAVALFASLHGAAAALAPRGGLGSGSGDGLGGGLGVVARPAAHTLAEAIRMVMPFGGVPLATLGISQVAGPLGVLARLGGVLLITWATLQVGIALARVFAAARPATARPAAAQPANDTARMPTLVAAATAIVVLALTGLAYVAPDGSDTGDEMTIAAVQGGGPQGTRAINTPDQVVIDRHIEATRTIPDDAGRTGDVDLVLWPENVIDVDGIPFEGSPAHQQVIDEAARIGAPFSVGVTEDAGPGRFTNAQVVVTPEGDIVSRYDKVRRVPFGEYMPFRDVLASLGAPVDQVPNDAVAGTGPALLTAPTAALGAVDMGVVISWEVFFGGRAREGVEAGGALVTNPTNGSSYTWTILQTQQVASSRLRALETGRWVVQVAPTGLSAFVSPTGEVFDRTAVSEQAVITRTIELRDGATWYVRIGDHPVVVLLVLTLIASWLLQRRLRSRSAA
jgi:apolipoprotein N-acyltransferase